MQTVYWDANIFHALFGKEPGRVEKCLPIEKAAQEGHVLIYTSAVTFVECVWVKGQPDKLSKEHELILQRYFMHKYIRVINCDRQIAEAARLLVWQFPHLKPRDAIHVASAVSVGVDVMHSYDNDDLVKLSEKIGTPPLKIGHPGNENDISLTSK